MKLATVTYTDGRTLPYDVEIRRVRNSEVFSARVNLANGA
jgi:hypothetical protein